MAVATAPQPTRKRYRHRGRLTKQGRVAFRRLFAARTAKGISQWARMMRPIFERQRVEVVHKLRRWAPPKVSPLPEESIDDILLNHREWNVILAEGGRKLGEVIAHEAGNGLVRDLAITGVSFDVKVPEVQELLDLRYGNPEYGLEGTWPQWINEGTNQQLRDGLRDELHRHLSEGIDGGESIAQLEKRVGEVFDRRKSYQTERIARTEAMGAHAHGADAAMKQVGAKGKEWLTSQGSDVRDWHQPMEGVIVAFDKPFMVPSSKGGMTPMMHPHAFGAPAEQVINCRCMCASVSSEEEVREAEAARAE